MYVMFEYSVYPYSGGIKSLNIKKNSAISIENKRQQKPNKHRISRSDT